MSNSSTNLDLISSSQAEKEVTANGLFDAESPAVVFGRRASTTTGLTWGYYGGNVLVSGVPTQIANGTVALTASTTNYVYATSAGVVTVTTTLPTGWPGPITSPAGATALYTIVTGTSTVTSYTDWRLAVGQQGPTGPQGASWSVTVNAQTGTTYTIVAGDNGKVITLSNAAAITVTVPSGLGANFSCELIQIGAGQVAVSAGASVTVNSYNSLTHLAGQHAAATLVAYVADTFNLSGNLV